jgi:hypothetical protein
MHSQLTFVPLGVGLFAVIVLVSLINERLGVVVVPPEERLPS